MNIVVLGGGTAGWLSALFVQRVLPKAHVTVVHSSPIGVIGVGEGTVPHIRTFLDRIGITPEDLVSECGATFKLGVSFENWNGDGRSYFHPFRDARGFSVPGVFSHDADSYYIKSVVAQGLDPERYVYTTALAAENKIDLSAASTALHFDAAKFITFLERIAESRNIKNVDAEMVSLSRDEHGYVTALHLSTGHTLSCDFVIDASGQHRRILGRELGVEWLSRRDELPMNRALPFWLPAEPETRPYTRAIAMSAGWMWQIPVEGRVGAGCVFSDKFATPEEVVREAEELLGREIAVRKDIPFEAGESALFWDKNVMAVGLSAAFVEPLEATSIWVTCEQLNLFAHFLPECSRPRQGSLNIFNRYMRETMGSIRSFLHLHYLTRRGDSEFWRTFRSTTTTPEGLAQLLEDTRLEDFMPGPQIAQGVCRFDLHSYLSIMSGLGMLSDLPHFTDVSPSPEEHREEIALRKAEAPHHDRILNDLRSAGRLAPHTAHVTPPDLPLSRSRELE